MRRGSGKQTGLAGIRGPKGEGPTATCLGKEAIKQARAHGISITKKKAAELARYLVELKSTGFLAKQLVTSIWRGITKGRRGSPALTRICRAALEAADIYQKAQAQGKTLTEDELKDILKKAKARA